MTVRHLGMPPYCPVIGGTNISGRSIGYPKRLGKWRKPDAQKAQNDWRSRPLRCVTSEFVNAKTRHEQTTYLSLLEIPQIDFAKKHIKNREFILGSDSEIIVTTI